MTQNYIERYWRDATPQDAIKEPPMVARFRVADGVQWRIEKLNGYNRKLHTPWGGDEWWFETCQVYDAPDPGEGWRLVDVASEKWQEGDEIYDRSTGTWRKRLTPFQDWALSVNRRRIEPTVTYVPFTWEDREQLRGRWVTWKHENGLMIESQIDHINQHRDGGVWFKSHDAKWLLENATFLDTGKPVGKEVEA